MNKYLTLGNCLFGAGKLSKISDPDKYGYSDYGIVLNARSQFSWSEGSWGKNIVIFEVDITSYVEVDNKKMIS